MKNMRKLFAVVLAVVMVLSLATTAFAEETEGEATGYTITVNGKVGHTYEVYQIFTGDLHEGVLSNIVWGDGVTAEGQTDDAAAKAETLIDADDAKAFAAEVVPYLTNPTEMTAGEEVEGKVSYTASGLAAGYYLIKDQDNSQEEDNGTYTAYILKVVEDVEATPKDSVPTVDKSVTEQDKNADDFNIGDEVTFILKATLGSNVNEYETYKVIFHDTMSVGLTYTGDENVTVTIDGIEITAYTVTHENGVLTVTIADVIALGAKDGSEIIVTYTAVLNNGAEIGQPGNPNEVYLEYSNNPNWDGNGDEPTGNTPEDEVVVFTYELDVTKVDGENGNVLPGAEFVLYRTTVEEETVTEYVVLNEEGRVTGWTTDKAAASTLTSDENGLFQVIGLDAGTYYLEETKAPAGYNLLTAPIEIVITATLNTAEDQGALEALTIAVNGGEAVDGDVTTGVVATTVENNSGTQLPETGGMGTTLFYLFGGVLVLAAVVLLVTKKRMASAE